MAVPVIGDDRVKVVGGGGNTRGFRDDVAGSGAVHIEWGLAYIFSDPQKRSASDDMEAPGPRHDSAAVRPLD